MLTLRCIGWGHRGRDTLNL